MNRKEKGNYLKDNYGITLIALVITIIVLIILAALSINLILGDNRIINKAINTKDIVNQSAAMEKIQLIISELIIEQAKKSEIANIDDLQEYVLNNNDIKIKKESDITAIIGIDGYAFRIDEKLNIIENVSISLLSDVEAIYEINSTNGNNESIVITIIGSTEIEKIITPEGNEIIPQADKRQITIDYNVISGNNYMFKVKLVGTEEIKEYVLRADTNSKPEINQDESAVYPMITEYGVELIKKVEIDYGEGTNNYYSIDNGQTWQKYTDTLKIKDECTLMAKTILNGEITKISKKEIKLELANDTIGSNAYDGKDTTSVGIVNNSINSGLANVTKRMDIDASIYGKIICVDYTSRATSGSTSGNTGFYFYDLNNKLLSDNVYTTNSREVKEITVPKDAAYMTIYRVYGTATIYEIALKNEPIIEAIQHYPLLVGNKVESSYCTAEILYDSTSVQKLYKIDDGEWQNYDNQTIRLKIDEVLYAKGIDKNGKETRIVSSYKSELSQDALKAEAYDGKDTTGVSIVNNKAGSKVEGIAKRIDIDSSAYGKIINIDFISYATSGTTSGYTAFYFYDLNNELLLEKKYTTNNTRKIEEITVPNDSVYMEIYRDYGTVIIYEITPIN